MTPLTRPVSVVRTSTANLASVGVALERLGCTVRFVSDARAVARAARVVLPGVGAFAAAWRAVAVDGLAEALGDRVAADRPTLGICLGMQLMAAGSQEAPGTPGLGALSGVAERYEEGVRVPQMGWNEVVPDDGCRIVPRGFAYFANSYRLTGPTTTGAASWRSAWSHYGGRFLAAAERGAVVACQFHPELSGAYGRALLSRWVTT